MPLIVLIVMPHKLVTLTHQETYILLEKHTAERKEQTLVNGILWQRGKVPRVSVQQGVILN